MNTKTNSKIIVLSAIMGLGGCATSEPIQSIYADQQPILSATEAQSMIRVSVRTLPHPDVVESIVASVN